MDSVRMLWMDDQIDGFAALIYEMETVGFTVDTAINTQEALYKMINTKYDVIVADLLMPPPNGVDFLRDAQALDKECVYIVFSGFLYSDDYRHRIEELGLKIHRISKEGAITNVYGFRNYFIKPMLELLPYRAGSRLSRLIDALELKPGWGGIAIDLKKFFKKRAE